MEQRIGDELCRHLRAHRPADNASREQIDDDSHIEPTLRCPNVGKISNPFAIGSWRREGAVEHVRSDDGDLPLAQIGAVDAGAVGL